MPTGIYKRTEEHKKKISEGHQKREKKLLFNNCLLCNKKFQVYPFQLKIGEGKYCSMKCRNIAFKGRISPLKGKKTGRIPKSAFKKGYISLRKNKKRPQYSGKNHWNYQGGLMSENQKQRDSLEIKLWKKANLERDNFTCQKCKIIGGKLVIHHINNFADFEELRTAISNGITFCKNCHNEFHKKYGRKNNTREQLNEFLL